MNIHIIYINIYNMYIYIYIYIYIYMLSCAQVHELPKSNCGDNREGAMFS